MAHTNHPAIMHCSPHFSLQHLLIHYIIDVPCNLRANADESVCLSPVAALPRTLLVPFILFITNDDKDARNLKRQPQDYPAEAIEEPSPYLEDDGSE